MTIGDEVVVGCSTFSSGSENDESEEEDFEDDIPEKEDNVMGSKRTSKWNTLRDLFL
jgi:hypothetical protein